MPSERNITGQQTKWELVKKLGEGDAGEVYLVRSLLEGKPAILKRPRKTSFASDSLRQAGQIRSEASILQALSGAPFPPELRLSLPALLDQSPPENGIGERTFIIIEQAPGVDLKRLRQIHHFGLSDELELPDGAQETFFLEKWAKLGEMPAPLLVRILYSVIVLLETIHSYASGPERARTSGVLWNDVKPEHLYWHPARASLMVIDWGNSQFLEIDGTTKDRQFSRIDDLLQFMQEMGAFLAEASPELHATLEWPSSTISASEQAAAFGALKEKLYAQYQIVLQQLHALRQQETDLYGAARPELDHLEQADNIHGQLAAFGEMPDLAGALNFHARAALLAAAENRLDSFQDICTHASKLPTANTAKWNLLCEIATLAQDNVDEETPMAFGAALEAGLADDWPAALWELFTWAGEENLPDWWGRVSLEARRIHFSLGNDALTPYIFISRLFYTLQAALQQKANQLLRASSQTGSGSYHLQGGENLLREFNDDVVKKWREVEPAPPNAGIGYDEVSALAARIDELLPGAGERLDKALAQVQAQAGLVLNAWERKDFELARRGLRLLLLCDPDRRRLISAERAIASAEAWLSRLRKGAAKAEPFYDYLTTIELDGRRLRSRVGAAQWLNDILEALKRMRKGTRSVDLLMEFPEIAQEIPWLSETSSREVLSLPHTRPLTLERDNVPQSVIRTISGVVETRLGPNEEVSLAEPLDTWAPEARGSSARVFAGMLSSRAGPALPLAVKIMRPDRIEYALPLFREEVQALTLLRDIPGITPLVELGFMKFDEGLSMPGDESHAPAAHLRGALVRCGVEEAQNFLAALDRRLAAGWLPYLALVKRNHLHNLIRYCDAGYTHGWFLPLREGLLLGVQICDILQTAHDRNILYRDHKILHYYWEAETHGVTAIDWNIAKRQPQGLSEAERQFDIVQFGARALHHILTGRPAQGSLALGPNRPEDIERASLRYPVSWTYDDERLPNRVKEILEQALNQGYTQARDLRKDLEEIYQQLNTAAQNPGGAAARGLPR